MKDEERSKAQIIVWVLLLAIFLLIASFLVYIKYELPYFLGFVAGILFSLLAIITSVGIMLNLIPEPDC